MTIDEGSWCWGVLHNACIEGVSSWLFSVYKVCTVLGAKR